MTDREFAFWLAEKARVAAVPVSAFYKYGRSKGMARFCFAKKEEIIITAVQNLKEFFGA